MLLAKDGIFPIVWDKHGQRLPTLPASGFSLSGTIQGEGKLNGIPSLFIRLAGCNLHCCWKTVDGYLCPCDTAYAAYQIKQAQQWSVEDICQTIRHNTGNIQHIVITGGEPFLQNKELKQLCTKLKEEYGFHLTVETNGTVFDEGLARQFDLLSISPKLSSSHQGSTYPYPGIAVKCIQKLIDCAAGQNKEFQLKFVYSAEEDIDEIRLLLAQLQHWKNEDILLMPLGGNTKTLRSNMNKTLEQCIRNGWRYCDRLHISLFGDKAGV